MQLLFPIRQRTTTLRYPSSAACPVSLDSCLICFLLCCLLGRRAVVSLHCRFFKPGLLFFAFAILSINSTSVSSAFALQELLTNVVALLSRLSDKFLKAHDVTNCLVCDDGGCLLILCHILIH